MDYYPQSGEYHAGGNALNQAIQFSQQGMESAFIGAIGSDDPGDRIARLLRQAGVDCSRLRRIDGNTASNQILVDERGERSGIEGAWSGGVYTGFRMNEDDWECIRGADIIATHADCPDYLELISRVRGGPLVAVDFLHMDDFELMRRSSGTVDIVYSGGHVAMAGGLQQVAMDTNMLVVLTLGADGSMAFHRGKVYRQPALPLDKVVDTTGCGDAFQAAFTCEYMKSGNVRDSLMRGALAASLAAGRIGAAEWL